MPRNSLGYTGRIVVRDGESIDFSRTASGMFILNLVLMESHQMKKSKARKDPKLKSYVDDPYNASQGDDDYINVMPSWHRITVFGDKAEQLALNPEINSGALVEVIDASYSEEAPWPTRDGVLRAGRPESIGDNHGSIDVLYPPREPKAAIWDGLSEVPEPSRGGGGGQERQLAENEGF